MSNISDGNYTTDSFENTSTEYTITLILLCCTWIIIINSLVLVCLVLNKDAMHQFINMQLLGLSITDILVGITAIPMSLTHYITQNTVLCSAIINGYLVAQTATLYHAFGICFHRYITVKYRKSKTTRQCKGQLKRIIFHVAAIWCFVIGLVVIPCACYTKFDNSITECSLNTMFGDNYIKLLVVINTLLLVPQLGMNVLYISLFRYLSKKWRFKTRTIRNHDVVLLSGNRVNTTVNWSSYLAENKTSSRQIEETAVIEKADTVNNTVNTRLEETALVNKTKNASIKETLRVQHTMDDRLVETDALNRTMNDRLEENFTIISGDRNCVSNLVGVDNSMVSCSEISNSDLSHTEIMSNCKSCMDIPKTENDDPERKQKHTECNQNTSHDSLCVMNDGARKTLKVKIQVSQSFLENERHTLSESDNSCLNSTIRVTGKQATAPKDRTAKERDVLYTIGIILLLLNIFMTPLNLLFLTEMILDGFLSRKVKSILMCLALINSGLNPLVYAFKMKPFRDVLKHDKDRCYAFCRK